MTGKMEPPKTLSKIEAEYKKEFEAARTAMLERVARADKRRAAAIKALTNAQGFKPKKKGAP